MISIYEKEMKGKTMDIITLPVGYLKANCYILKKGKNAIIIDPGDEYEKIIQEVDESNVIALLVTHHHEDHIGALESLEKYYHIKPNEWKDLNIEIIKTPGHTKDSISFYFPEENILFSGDFIFQQGIGRWDLETGNWKEMQESIKKILDYPNMQIYPGHGEKTTLKEEESYLRQFI